ncbi:glycosyltransferase [Blastococcus saxobsidens]|uniref:glycosyltransferase n=1 Tax=Blastococcus saxobsidens TaxID=138336 RepID=UPI00131544E0|nr:glycosyltransferase [Blastococcus saxobsidens]
MDFTAAKLLAPQLEHLSARGYDVHVACGRTSEEHWGRLSSFTTHDIAFPRSPSPSRMLTSTSELVRVVRRVRPALLHLHTPAAALPARLVPRSLWPRHMKIAYTVHGFSHQWPPRGPGERLVQRLEKGLAKRTDLLLFQSEEDLAEASAREYGEPLVLLGNGVQDEWFEISAAEHRGTGPLRLVYVGRLVREKGILDLLEAVNGVDGVHLDIVGDALPSDRDGVSDEVRARAAALGPVFVTVHGMAKPATVRALVERAHALSLPSYREGVPRSVIEALAAGRPVIASEIRGNRELVTHGKNGLMHPAGDVDSLRRAVVAMRNLNRDDYARMVTEARRSADPSRREAGVYDRLVRSYESLEVLP